MKTLFRLLFLVGLSVSHISNLSAQLCSGSLGDPVVNITFGQGINPGPSLAPGVTNYGYVTSSCPNDGFYNIGTTTTACFADSWHTINTDHTEGDVNGYMMIINASNSPGDFYVDSVRGLCPSTTYEFAAWILNVIKPSSCGSQTIKPNVTFNIETLTGTVLLKSQTGDIDASSPVWKQYGAFFTTPDGTSSVVIRMTNNALGGCGNDLLLDDITFRPCGAKVTGVTASGSDSKDLCIGDTSAVTMTAVASQSDNNTFYQWQQSTNGGNTWVDIAGANTNTFTRPPNASSAGTFLYRSAVAQGTNIFIPNCRVYSNVITVAVNEYPVPNAANNGPKCEGDTLALIIASDWGNYTWTGPNNFSSVNQPGFIRGLKASDAGLYTVSVTSTKGCTTIDSTVVTVNPTVVAEAGANITICKGNSTQLNGTGGAFYSWSPIASLSAANIANPVASPDTTTRYLLAVSNGTCTAFDSVLVTVLNAPVANAGPDLKLFQGQSGVLNATASGASVTIAWSPPFFINNTRTLIPVVSPPVDTTYTLTVSSTIGCGTATDKVFVRVYKVIKVPNAFSPNGDGINDLWQIEALETYPEATLSVFNRYGQLVYSAGGAGNPWDGTFNNKPLPVGTYYYIIDLKNGQDKKSGSIVILR